MHRAKALSFEPTAYGVATITLVVNDRGNTGGHLVELSALRSIFVAVGPWHPF
jgi:hypothetical protein